jgi:hypothetical protein
VSYLGVLVAGFYSYSHAYDKIWLYYAYEVAWQFKGSGQTYILRHLDFKNDGGFIKRGYNPTGNRGSLPNGQLTWEEFIRLLNNAPPDKAVPALTDDLEKVAGEIWKTGWIKKKLIIQSAVGMNNAEYHEFIKSCGDMMMEGRPHKTVSRLATLF